MCDNDNVVTDEVKLINKLLTINEPLPLQSSICYSQR
jgi:hypothetical protein